MKHEDVSRPEISQPIVDSLVKTANTLINTAVPLKGGGRLPEGVKYQRVEDQIELEGQGEARASVFDILTFTVLGEETTIKRSTDSSGLTLIFVSGGSSAIGEPGAGTWQIGIDEETGLMLEATRSNFSEASKPPLVESEVRKANVEIWVACIRNGLLLRN